MITETYVRARIGAETKARFVGIFLSAENFKFTLQQITYLANGKIL
ncbi:hypothetical protein [Xenorhabdus thailandensis]